MKKNIVILGAYSGIAKEVSRLYAKDGNNLFLIGRDVVILENMISDLKIRGANNIYSHAMDLNDFGEHTTLLTLIQNKFKIIDIIFLCYGSLTEQQKAETDFQETLKELNTNLLGPISLISHFSNILEKNKHGNIAVVTSVSGDRGRQSNYIYGTAKGGLSIFLQGIRNRLFKTGVYITDIKPGYVSTPMTANIPKNFLFADPKNVAKKIYRAIKKNKETVYVPWFWFFIMAVIKLIPEKIFKRLKL